jgi:hypothetical protein
MPYGTPPYVKPWLRDYWPNLNKGQKLYSITAWQEYCIRNNNDVRELNLELDANVAEELNVPTTWMGTKARNQYNKLIPERDIGEIGNDNNDEDRPFTPQTERSPVRTPTPPLPVTNDTTQLPNRRGRPRRRRGCYLGAQNLPIHRRPRPGPLIDITAR